MSDSQKREFYIRGHRFLRIETVMHKIGAKSTSVIYRFLNGDGCDDFPQPTKLGNTTTVVWDELEIDDWIVRQLAKRNAQPIEQTVSQ
jgi:predicted DNA-binding transcriptional regulator AlpA